MFGRSRSWIFILGLLVAMGLVFGLDARFGGVPHPYDKIGHFFGFLFATLVLGLFLRNYFLAMILAILVGIGIEVAQYFSSNRYFSFNDIVADSSGAVAGWIVALIVTAVVTRRKKRSA